MRQQLGFIFIFGRHGLRRERRFDWRRGDWEIDSEGCAAPIAGAVGRDLTAVQLDQVAHNRQSQSQTAVLSRGRAVGLTETGKDVREKIRTDALTGVAHGDLDLRLALSQLHLHASAPRCELDRVREQVPNDLLQALWVSEDLYNLRIEV